MAKINRLGELRPWEEYNHSTDKKKAFISSKVGRPIVGVRGEKKEYKVFFRLDHTQYEALMEAGRKMEIENPNLAARALLCGALNIS